MALKTLHRFWRSAYAFPLACIAALGLLAISEVSYRRASNAMADVGNMAAARIEIQSLWRHLTDAETGQRGYLLTGRSEYLQPYREALTQVDTALRTLTAYYAAQPQSAAVMAQLATASKDKLSELATTLRMHDENNASAWRELLLTNIGHEKMEAIRTTARQLLELESKRLQTERTRVLDSLWFDRIGVGAMTAVSLLALSLYRRQTRTVMDLQREQKLAVQVERDRLEVEVQNRTAQLVQLTRHLQTAREDERSRLARELHDELGALLTAAKLDAARLKARLGATTAEITERLVHLNKLLNDGIALKRQIIENLRPSSLTNLGLVAALEIIASEFGAASGLQIHTALVPVALSSSGELTAYRLVQEALTNIAKYASATEVWVELKPAGDACIVGVRDNGCGFDTGVAHHAAHGLLGMRYRVEAESGHMTLTSEPGHGTLVQARIPMSSSAASVI